MDPPGREMDNGRVEGDGGSEEDSMSLLEDRFFNLALKFRRSMNLYGLFADVTLLFDPRATAACLRARKEDEKLEGTKDISWSLCLRRTGNNLAKLVSLALVLLANSMAVYVLLAHFIWEYRMLDAKASASDSQLTASGGKQGGQKNSSMLKDFLENLRRHLARFFSLGLTLTWHLGCHKIEGLFIDCQRYYSMFYKKAPDSNERANNNDIANEDFHSQSSGVHKNAKSELLEAGSRFYRLASHRINLALWLPFLHYLFNILSVSIFPSSSKRPSNRLAPPHATANGTVSPLVPPAGDGGGLMSSMLSRALENFDSFHLAIHTAFHPYDHRIAKAHPTLQGDSNVTVVSRSRSAIYCLIELFVYSMYFNGPRIICATCLSLVLHIHYQCIRAFNKQLMGYIKRPRGRPLSSADVVSLVKQYDLIGMMHERIERTFKWSIVLWYTLMFISCLMHIFSFTESTSAYVVSSSTATPPGSSQASINNFSSLLPQQQQQRQQSQAPTTNWSLSMQFQAALPASAAQQPPPPPPVASSTSPSIAIMFIRFASVFFVCYSPCLIYSEAFKIESASIRVEQLVMRLARRQDDPLAQAIEPTLFEPIYLSVGGYFDLTKKSMLSFLGAVVTFSVMFIADNNRDAYLTPAWDEDQEEPEEEAANEEDDPAAAAEEQDQEEEEEEEEEDDDDEEFSADSEPPNRADLAANEIDLDEQQDDTAPPAADLAGDAPHEAAQMQLSRRLGLLTPSERNLTQDQQQQQQKARQRRKFRRLNLKLMKQQANASTARPQPQPAPMAAPRLDWRFKGRVREHERLVELTPKLRVLNQAAEVCDFELRPAQASFTNSQQQQQQQQQRKQRRTQRRWSSTRGQPDKQVGPGMAAEIPFVISWIDRVNGEATLEALREDLMDCERKRNYTFGIRAIGCNGLNSNEALVSITTEDVNEFSPEFERHFYSVTHEQEEWDQQPEMEPAASSMASADGRQPNDRTEDNSGQADKDREEEVAEEEEDGRLLLAVQARDRDCSPEFGSICRYELLADQQDPRSLDGLSIDSAGRIWMHRRKAEKGRLGPVRQRGSRRPMRRMASREQEVDGPHKARRSFQVIAYDCGGKKSQTPASVQVNFNRLCRPALKDVDTRVAYKPGSGARSPFLRTQLDLCGSKCHRPNISIALRLEATPLGQQHQSTQQEQAPARGDLYPEHGSSAFHCDRDTYSMVSKRRLCGAPSRAMELLPPLSAHTNWILPLTRQTPLLVSPATTGSGGSEQVFVASEDGAGDENLGAYSAEGSYSLRALQFQLDEANSQTLETPVGSGKPPLQARKAARGRTADSRIGNPQQRRSRVQKQQQPSRRLAARSAPTTSKRRSQESERARHIDPGSVYRDQVYRFDGYSSAVQVPRTVFASDSFTWINNRSHQEQSGKAKQHLFGDKHTISFWMRHSPSRLVEGAALRQQQQGTIANGNGSLETHPDLEELDRHAREHLLCATLEPDQAGSNHGDSADHQHAGHSRHYYAVFIRNCRLVLLMRRKLPDVSSAAALNDSKVYMPAEWRWSLPANEACDNKWHLYTINVNFPSVELYIDGSQFEESYDNLVIVDHLPIAPATPLRSAAAPSSSSVTYEDEPPEVVQSQESTSVSDGLSLGLGACWEAHHRSWSGHFRGSLSGLSVLPGDNDDSRSIECLGSCSEELVSTAQGGSSAWPMQDQEQPASTPPTVPMDDGPAMKMDNSLVSYQESQSKILLQGHDFLDVEEALTQIAYINHRMFPSIGKRNIVADTQVDCSSSSSHGDQAQQQSTSQVSSFSIPIEPVRIEVDVLPSKSLPVLTISGTPNLAREYGPFILGIRLFSSISLQSKRLNLKHFLRTSPPNITHKTPTITNNSPGNLSAIDNSDSRTSQLPPEDADYIDDSVAMDGGQQQQPQQLKQAQRRPGAYANLAPNRRRIESCSVQVYPPLNGLHESLVLPLDQIDALQLYWRQSHEGFIIYGLDSLDNYERIVRSIVYRNQKPAYYLERVFKLLCTDLNGRLLSNEYLQTVTIIHDSTSTTITATGADLEKLQNEQVASQKPALLRQTDRIELNGEGEPIIMNSFAIGQHHQPIGALNLEQSTRLDRIAMAFLVFVVSLIVIMLVITLTNLKEPSIRAVPSGSRKGRKSRDRKLYYDLNPENRPDCLYVDELASDLDEDEDEEEGIEEEEEEEYGACDRGCYTRSGGTKSQVKFDETSGPVRSSAHFSSNTTDQESLAWDEEGLDEADEPRTTTIVMNPIAHANGEQQTTDGSSFRRVITEQRPNWRGLITQKPKSRLSLARSMDFMGTPDEYEFQEPRVRMVELSGSSSKQSRRTKNRRFPMPLDDDDDEELSSCCSSSASSSGSSTASSASSSSSSSSSSSEGEDGHEEDSAPAQELCRGERRHNRHLYAHHHHHHRHNHHPHHHHHYHHSQPLEQPIDEEPAKVFWSTDDPVEEHYELYHKHHFHHRCLKRPSPHRAPRNVAASDEDDVDVCSSNGSDLGVEAFAGQPAHGQLDCKRSGQLSALDPQISDAAISEDWPSDLTAALTCAETSSPGGSSLALASSHGRRSSGSSGTTGDGYGSMKSDTTQATHCPIDT